MEEKLYFKPENYEKRNKTKKPKSLEPTKTDQKPLLVFFRIGLVLLILIILIIVAFYFLRGKTIITTEKIPNIESTLLSCSSDSNTYPIFTYDKAKARRTSVKMIFSEEKLKSIALEYSLFYDSVEESTVGEARNHAAMNLSFQKVGLAPDAYSAKYTILSDQARMNLYATSKKLDETAKRYFLVETDGTFPTSAEELRKNYEAQGFTCETSE